MADSLSPLPPDRVAAALRSAAAAIRAELAAFPADVLCWHPAPGEWCVLEVVGHLIAAETRGFAGRVRLILDHPEPEFETWDQGAVARARRDCTRDPAAVLEEFAGLRDASVALVSRLQEADLGRGGRHPTVGHLLVSDLLHEWIHHDRNHLRQMLANVQAAAWPHMGNARRFSQP